MVRKLKSRFKAPKKVVPRDKRSVTPLVYYGGKSRDSQAIIAQFPPHDTFVDVFGGGGAVIFAKEPSVVDIYNDLGNVSNFYKCLRDYGDDLYDALYHTPFSREEYYKSRDLLSSYIEQKMNKNLMSDDDLVEWARCWYVVIMQSFTHEERSTSWKVTKSMDLANAWNGHVDDLPRFIEKLRTIVVENMDFMQVLKLYNSPKTLFYLDPPYADNTRKSTNNYVNELTDARHVEMLTWLTTELKGQAVVSMYSNPTYEQYLKDWRRVSIVHNGAIHNSKGKSSERKEIIWVKEFLHGLWSEEFQEPEISQATLPGI